MVIGSYSFTHEGIDYRAELRQGVEHYPDALIPVLVNANSGKDVVVYDILWSDIKEEISPSRMALSIISRFNSHLEEVSGKKLSYNDELALIFNARLVYVDGILKVKEG